MFSKASIAFSTASRQSFNIRGQNIREELRSLEPSAPIDQRISLYETLYQVGQSNPKENPAFVHFLLQSGSLRKAIKLLISEIRKEPFNLQLLVRLKSVLSDFNRPFLSNLIKDYILKRIPDSIQ